MNEEDDLPDLGDRVDGRILVCHGDDWPEDFIGWLDPLVSEFKELLEIAERYEFALELADGQPLEDVTDFCDALGIKIDRQFWEGSCISGIYHWGWITVGTQRQIQKTGRRILGELRKFTKGAIRDWQRAERKRILRELESIKNFDTLVARTTDDRGEMADRICQLENELQSARDELAQATEELLAFRENDTREVDRGCLELLAALAFKRAERCVAGPLALWDDGVVYAITQIGGFNLPEPSTYAWLLRQLEAASVQVVKVKEMTILGGRASGPIYYPGGTRAQDWINVWREGERPISRLPSAGRGTRPRKFIVDPPEYAERVSIICAYLGARNYTFGHEK